MTATHRNATARRLAPLAAGLLAALAGLVLGACGGSLYDAAGVPKLEGGNQCNADQHLCPATGNVCQDHDLGHCGAACAVCTTTFPGASATCQPAGNDWQCGYTCAAGLFECASGCCQPAAVATGGDQACALTSDGSVQCWGANGSGQLGRTGVGGPAPGEVAGLVGGVSAVAVGGRHACAIRGGTVWCWGADDLGQLGDGAATSSGPTPVSTGLGGATRLAAGADHTCALSGGQVRCWGANVKGQVGTGAAGGPVTAPALVAGLGGVEELAASADTTCARSGGQVRCWGANGSGQVGSGSALPAVVTTPTLVAGLPGPAASIAVGGQHACAVVAGAAVPDDDGLSCWGANAEGQLGTGAVGSPLLAPTRSIGLDNNARAVLAIAGTAFTCMGKDALGLKCGGRNDQGQAGGGVDPLLDGADVSFGGNVAAASAGDDHACALVDLTPPPAASRTLVVKCWGRNAEGQLGRATVPAGAPDGAPGTVGG
ncbi:MAG: hypothetical protein IPO09_06600 [Anaeromyxobacter sp.]|nr:hypothetical protein [Anaeromyxobacter sp.]